MMSVAETLQMTERLPPELLEKILMHTPIPDIIRLTQVNRGFRDFIQDSPYTKHRIDLFAAGLEDNSATNLTLADRRRAFNEYRTRWETFEPTRQRERWIDSIFNTNNWAKAFGVFAFIADPKEFVEFFTTESISRGTTRKEWKFPLPDSARQGFAINPHADVLVIVAQGKAGEHALHLLSMTSGLPHPAAENPIIIHRRKCRPISLFGDYSISITDSRLAILVGPPLPPNGMDIVVWDWRTGCVLLDHGGLGYRQLGFVDEYSLAVLADSDRGNPPRLQILNTERGTIKKPTRTSFSFSTAYMDTHTLYLSSEPCGHISPDDLSTAPFYSDPSQRILALYFGKRGACYAVNVELLLGLAREREGQNIRWEEWGAHTIEIPVGGLDLLAHTWVSGCRLFRIVSDGLYGNALCHLQIYDFSHAGRVKHLHTLDRTSQGRGTRWISPSLYGYKLPWGVLDLWYATAGLDSILFCIGSAQESAFGGGSGSTTAQLHVWNL